MIVFLSLSDLIPALIIGEELKGKYIAPNQAVKICE